MNQTSAAHEPRPAGAGSERCSPAGQAQGLEGAFLPARLLPWLDTMITGTPRRERTPGPGIPSVEKSGRSEAGRCVGRRISSVYGDELFDSSSRSSAFTGKPFPVESLKRIHKTAQQTNDESTQHRLAPGCVPIHPKSKPPLYSPPTSTPTSRRSRHCCYMCQVSKFPRVTQLIKSAGAGTQPGLTNFSNAGFPLTSQGPRCPPLS